MNYHSYRLSPDIKLSFYEDKQFKREVLFEQHLLVWFIAGETKIIQTSGTKLYKAGDIFLIPRNQLATIINYPTDGRAHQSVVMHLNAPMLKKYYEYHKPHTKLLAETGIRDFGRHPLLESCLASLVPYFDLQVSLPEDIAMLKIKEALTIIRTIDPDVDSILSNFSEPGKISLPDFMEKNYMFNMPLEKFSYLTGRSLTTFKRDFKKAYQTTPQSWLTSKRLELAHFQLSQQRRRPSDIYLEVGFENLSHFTSAFKKHFGYTPSGIAAERHT